MQDSDLRMVYARTEGEGDVFPKFRVRGLDLFYGNFRALKAVDMDISAREITDPRGAASPPSSRRSTA